MSDNNPHNKGRRKSALKHPTTEFKRKPSESYVLYRQSTTTNDGNSSKILFCESVNSNNILGQNRQDNKHKGSHVRENDDIFCGDPSNNNQQQSYRRNTCFGNGMDYQNAAVQRNSCNNRLSSVRFSVAQGKYRPGSEAMDCIIEQPMAETEYKSPKISNPTTPRNATVVKIRDVGKFIIRTQDHYLHKKKKIRYIKSKLISN